MHWQLGLVALVAAGTVAAQLASWAGEYEGDQVRLTLQAARDGYTGTILYDGQSMPLTARESAAGLAGRFTADGEAFAFQIRRDGSTLVLATQGTIYRLEPVRTSKKGNPLARGPQPGANPPGAAEPLNTGGAAGGIVGTWRTPQGTMRFNADGTGIANGEAFRYQTDGANVTMMTNQGSVTLGYRLANANTLLLRGPGGEVSLERVGAGGPPAGNAPAARGGGNVTQELAGKWCYLSNVNATGGGARMSNICFTLHPNGQYEYYGETDSYGPNGGATSQSSDRGTWTATANTITSRSATGRVQTFQLERRNHPKTGDAMLMLDGEAFVTAYQRPPW